MDASGGRISRKRRMAFVAIAAAVFVTVYGAGTMSQVSREEAEGIRDEFMAEVKGIDAVGIFLNNFRIAAAMFIPALGVGVGLVSAYSTGAVFRALAETMPHLSGVSPFLILATPFGIMEVVSYGIAMSQSAILVTAIMRRSLRLMVVPTMIQLGLVGALLFAGAFIEFYMIEAPVANQELMARGI